MRVALIGSAGLGPVPTMKALASEGAVCVLAVIGDEHAPARHSRYCREVWALPPLQPAERFLEALLDKLEQSPVDVLLPLNDEVMLVMAAQRAAIERQTAYAAPPAEAIGKATDKGRMSALLAGRDDVLAPPVTILPEDPQGAADAWSGRYPVLVKPRTATGTEGVRLARDRAELDAVYRSVHARYPQPILQEHLDYPPGGKIALDYLFDHDGRVTARMLVRILEERALIGVGTGSGRKRGGIALTLISERDEDLLDRGMRTMQALGWRGFGFIEAVLDPRDGRYRTVDINPRLPGAGSLLPQLGMNFGYDACLIALGRTPVDRFDYRAGVRARRSADVMLHAKSLRSALQIFDPRYRAPTNLVSDPLPVMATIGSLIGKRLRG